MFSWVRLAHLAEWCGVPRPEHDTGVTAISTDSRTLRAGEVFLALRGDAFDGHDFVEAAVRRGAAAVIAERSFAVSAPVLVVPDALRAFVSIAAALRDRFTGPVIAVTGSAGKSSTKEMIAALLGPDTVRSPASFNNLLGVSKTIGLLEDSTRRLVLEMGMNAPGEIAEMCSHFRPEAGLITNIGDAHLGKLGSREGIYLAKKELFDSIAARDTSRGIALNTDDPMVVKAYEAAFVNGSKVVRYSALGAEADVRVLRHTMDPATGWLSIHLKIGASEHTHALPIFGTHHTENIAAALAATTLLGVDAATLFSRLDAIRPAAHRGEMHRLKEDRVLIDESYNSNPSALASSLKSLESLDPGRRRVLVVGEMREMGAFSERVHREAGNRIVESFHRTQSPIALAAVGAEAGPIAEVVRRALPEMPVTTLGGQTEVLPWLESQSRPHDILFFKGSHGVRLDLVVDRLVASEKKG